MSGLGDIGPVTPGWPARPSDPDAERRRRPPAPDKLPEKDKDRPRPDDGEADHVDEYVSE